MLVKIDSSKGMNKSKCKDTNNMNKFLIHLSLEIKTFRLAKVIIKK